MSIMYCLHAIQSAIHIIRYSIATLDIALNEPSIHSIAHALQSRRMLYYCVFLHLRTNVHLHFCTAKKEYIARDSRSLTHILYG